MVEKTIPFIDTYPLVEEGETTDDGARIAEPPENETNFVSILGTPVDVGKNDVPPSLLQVSLAPLRQGLNSEC